MIHARATSSPTERGGQGSGPQNRPNRLFSLLGGRPALFLLHNFDNPNLAERIDEHGGQVTDDEATADVILTRSRDEYQSLKDRYAISRKTHVRMSGFVDRCINANRFVLTPIPGKGAPGRIPGARRTEFTEDDDEHLCQYIADILPEKGEGGRTGHFIYTDLMRRADQFGQYIWAQRHTKEAWRERYRKNQGRLDQRIAEIVEENPPAPDGKGRYRLRRFGKLDRDDEDAEEFNLDAEAEEDAESSTDNGDDPVLAKRASAQPQEEEEEDGEEDQRKAEHHPDGEFSPRDQGSHHEEQEESQEAQAAGRRREAGPTPRSKVTRRKGRQEDEAPSPIDPDLTLLGPDGDDQLAQESGGSAPRAPPVVPSVPPSPPRTRARSRLDTAKHPELAPTPTRRRPATRAKAATATPSSRRARARSHPRSVGPREVAAPKAKSGVATLDAVAESESNADHDEFVAHSEDDGDMQEVEVNLRVDAGSRGGGPPADSRARSLSADDLQTSKRLRRARGASSGGAGRDEDEDEEDEDEEDSDAELLAHVRKLDSRPPPTLAKTSRRQNLKRVEGSESDELSAKEVFPSSGTRAQTERSRRTQQAKGAPYVPPLNTSAASMTKGKGKARETAPRHG